MTAAYAVDSDDGCACIGELETGEWTWDIGLMVVEDELKAGDLPGARPANSRTLMPFRGGALTMANVV